MEQLDNVFSFLPPGAQGPASALVIIIIGLIVAFILRSIIASAINATGLGKKAKTTGGNIGTSIGKAVFWLTLLYALYLALGRLGMSDTLQPINDLFRDIAGFVPKLIGAGFVLFIGYIVAKVAKNATQSTLEAAQIDNLAARTGMTSATGSQGNIAKTLATLVFVLIIIPVAIVALEALDINSISEPLSDMLRGFLDYIPILVAASLILTFTIFIGRWVSGILQSILPTFGFDRSINEVMMLDDGEGLSASPSKAAGYLAFLIILVIGVNAAVNVLGNDSLTEAFGAVMQFGGELIKAAILIVIGVFLANFVGRFMKSVVSENIANLFKYTAMVLFIFLGLSQLDADGQIIPRAFTLVLGAGAVAAAIAFGLGGREWAGKKLEEWKPTKGAARKTTRK